jgi:tRNA modification GTPase
MSKHNDTIYALSTSTGKSALDVIRVSGNKSVTILKKISSVKQIKTQKTNLVLLKYKKEIIDQVILIYLKAPKSFTGQDMLEIHCHGSPAIVKKISEVLALLGARLAEPGEFTKRALMNNKLDLVQTESLSDLINSETEKQRSLAISNLSGGLSSFVTKINDKLTLLLANTEALIDFSDEDLPKNILNKIKEQNKNIIKIIEKELKNSFISKPIREGFVVSVVGKPNTGKSSFINFVSKKNISIVTDIPGTTTDAISSSIDLYGYKFTFIDTAGIRKHQNKIEEIGIKKTKEIMLKSDLNLIFLENNEVNKYKNINNKIFVKSKLDKRKKTQKNKKHTNISSVTGVGINSLLKKTKDRLIKKKKNEPIFSRERHITIMRNALFVLKSIKFNESLDILAFKYREALRYSLEINQKFDIEDVLDIIFKDFCIGK